LGSARSIDDLIAKTEQPVYRAPASALTRTQRHPAVPREIRQQLATPAASARVGTVPCFISTGAVVAPVLMKQVTTSNALSAAEAPDCLQAVAETG
jgi:hypothetical protein